MWQSDFDHERIINKVMQGGSLYHTTLRKQQQGTYGSMKHSNFTFTFRQKTGQAGENEPVYIRESQEFI